MSLANTLSVLLNFKSDVSGLTRFTDFLSARLRQVEALNQQITNGSAAVNNALQAAAAYVSLGAAKAATAEAIQGRTAQAQLAQALRQTNQDTADYRAELAAAATARQRLTGIEDDAIAGVQRQLVFAKAQRSQIDELTRLTLDFAAAKEIDAVSASKAIGRALQGEGDELKRYGVEVDLTGDKVTGLINGLMKYSGQAEEAFRALPEGVRNLRVAGKEAQQAAGEVVLTISNPFLSGLADGLDKINARLNDISTNGSAVVSVIQGVSAGVGSFVGANLDRIVLLVGGFLALKGGAFALNEVIKVVAVTFMAFTKQNLAAMITGIWSLRKELGLFKAIATGGWAGAFAASLVAIGAALAIFAAGSIVISGIEQAQLARLEREQQIRDVIWDQLKALQAQVRTAKTTKEVTDAQIRTQAEYLEKKKRLDELEAKQEAGRKARLEALAASDGRRAVGTGVGALSAADAAELDTLKRSIALYAAVSASAKNKVGDDTPAPIVLTAEQRKAAADLADKRALFELETQIREAELDGNVALQERLIAERDQFLLLKELGNDAYDIAVARINLESEERKKKRDDAAKEKADEKAKEDAEKKKIARQRQAEERAHANLISLSQQKVAGIGADRFKTEEQKNAEITAELRHQNELIKARIAAIETQNLTAPEDVVAANNGTIDSLNKDLASNQGTIEEKRPLSFLETMQAQIVAMENSLGSVATRVASAFASVGESIRTSLGGAFADMILKGQSFKDAAIGFGQAVATSFVQAGAQMLADWIFQHTVMAGIRSAFHALGITEKVAATTTEVGIHATGEAAKTGASATGSLARKALMVGETIVHGAQWVLRTAAHIVGETTMTAVSLAQKAIRLPLILVETGAYLAKAAVAAMSAVASIPYVGPILAIAAMGAIIAAGAKLLKGGFAEGGIVNGPGTGTSDSIVTRVSNGEAITRAASVRKFGAGFFERLNAGVLDLTALPENIAAGMAAPDYSAAGAGGGGFGGGQDMGALVDAVAKKIRITPIIVADERVATRVARSGQAADDVVAIINARKSEIFRQGPPR